MHPLFQPLEQELVPALPYLRGDVLNAGCGDYDLAPFLRKHGATSVQNCDIASTIPGALICDLAKVPLPDASFDSMLCNAVLEHVQFPDLVMAELYRMLRPGGHLVLCIPFLQPYHACPTDYRRYTRQGMIELARLHHFEVIDVLPVHTLAQTVSWIVLEALNEKRHRLLKLLLYPPLRLWCRLSRRTDCKLVNNANTFQAILRKPSGEPGA